MNIYLRSFKLCLSEFRNDEQGSMTVFGLFFFLFTCILAAFAVDVSNLFAQRTHLQTAADQAGHAAIYRLWTSSDAASSDNQADAIDDARSIALHTLPRARTGGAIADEDIQIVFGDWNSITQTFAPGVGYSAVRVETSFRGTNAVASFFFRLIGFDEFDVYANSIWDTNANGCFTDGFVAQGELSITSNNAIGGDFCFVSNTEVTKNNNNFWGDFIGAPTEDTLPETSAIVVMPFEAYEDALADGNSGNPGWVASLVGSGYTPIPLLPRIENMMYDELRDIVPSEVSNFFGSSVVKPHLTIDDPIDMPSYIDESYQIQPVQLSNGNGQNSVGSITPLSMVTLGMTSPGVYYVDCPNNGTLNIDMDPSDAAYAGLELMNEMVIMTTCKLDFAQGSVIESGRFIVLNDDNSGSVTAASGVTFGTVDAGNSDCEASETTGSGDVVRASGVQIYTMGSAHFPAAFDAYGMQMVAMGDVSMSSGASGTNSSQDKDFIGSSIISGGEISLTTQQNIKIGCYPPEDDNTPNPEFFRMVN